MHFVFNKRRPMKKHSPASGGMSSIFIGVCAAPYFKKSDANPACGATQLSDARWRFETASNDIIAHPSIFKVKVM
jgi:hypothetical protein